MSLDVLAASPRIHRSIHTPTETFHRDRSHLTNAAVVLGRSPPWPRPPEALEDPSTCPTCPLEHYDAHAHHRTGLCRCTRTTPACRLCSSRHSPWPVTWGVLAVAPTPPSQSPKPDGAFSHANWALAPLRKLAGEYVTGGSAPWKKQRRRCELSSAALHPVHKSRATGNNGGLGPPGTLP